MSRTTGVASSVVRRYLAKVGTPVPQKTIWADLQDTGVFRSHTHFKRKVLASMKARGEVCSDAVCINCVCVCVPGTPVQDECGGPHGPHATPCLSRRVCVQFKQVVVKEGASKTKRAFMITMRSDCPRVQGLVQQALAADLPPIKALGEGTA